MAATTIAAIHNDCVYTLAGLAAILRRPEAWVMEHIIDAGCPHRKVESLYVVAGESCRLWVEQETRGGKEVGE